VARIFLAADVHGSTLALDGLPSAAAAARPDVVVLAGDLTEAGHPRGYAADLVRRLVSAVPGAPVLFVLGNRDTPDILAEVEAAGGRSIEKRVEVAADTPFVGLGSRLGEGIRGRVASTLGPGPALVAAIEPLIEPARTVLVPHHPPHGVVDRAWFGVHGGTRALRAAILRRRPKVVLCGHIHEARGVARLGPTLVVNPGPALRGFHALVETSASGAAATLLALPERR
jgi:hypothetical protein